MGGQASCGRCGGMRRHFVTSSAMRWCGAGCNVAVRRRESQDCISAAMWRWRIETSTFDRGTQGAMDRRSTDTWVLAPAWPKGPALIAVASMTRQCRRCACSMRADLLAVATRETQEIRENHAAGEIRPDQTVSDPG